MAHRLLDLRLCFQLWQKTLENRSYDSLAMYCSWIQVVLLRGFASPSISLDGESDCGDILSREAVEKSERVSVKQALRHEPRKWLHYVRTDSMRTVAHPLQCDPTASFRKAARHKPAAVILQPPSNRLHHNPEFQGAVLRACRTADSGKTIHQVSNLPYRSQYSIFTELQRRNFAACHYLTRTGHVQPTMKQEPVLDATHAGSLDTVPIEPYVNSEGVISNTTSLTGDENPPERPFGSVHTGATAPVSFQR